MNLCWQKTQFVHMKSYCMNIVYPTGGYFVRKETDHTNKNVFRIEIKEKKTLIDKVSSHFPHHVG